MTESKSFIACKWCDQIPPYEYKTCIESPSGKHEDLQWASKEEALNSYGLKGRQGVEDHSPAPRHPKPHEY